MNPWFFIHSLWVRDPRDRAHLKALWARDERQRGLMRWLVLLTLPALTLAGLLIYSTLLAALMFSCYALCHIWTCEDVNEAEFEAVLPARPKLRLHVLLLGALLPMLLVGSVTWGILHLVSPSHHNDYFHWYNLIQGTLFTVVILTALNYALRHRKLRFPAQVLALISVVTFMIFDAEFAALILVCTVAEWIGLNLCCARREVPVCAAEDFVESKSRWRLLVVIAAIAIPLLGLFYGLMSNFRYQAVIEIGVPLLLPLWTNLLAYLLIRFRSFCRRYFYVAVLLIVAATLLYRYYLTIIPPGGF